MAAGKWIGGVLGFITAGPLGALAGFALGSLFDHGLDAVNQSEDSYGNESKSYTNSGYSSGGYSSGQS